MIDERISVHDAFQLEIKQRLPFSPDGSSSRYTSETFLFIPSALNINRDTFPKSHFYRSLKNYIRLQVPSTPLPKLMGEGSLLHELIDEFRDLPIPDGGLLPPKQEESIRAHEQKTKIFCLTLQRAVREAVVEVENDGACKDAAQRCVMFARVARSILDQLWALKEKGSGELPVHISACQEFCSDVVSYQALFLLRFFETHQNLPDEPDARAALLDLIHVGAERRKSFSADTTPSREGDNVEFVSRWNTLKKYISSPLFLDIRRKREGAVIQHVAYSIAAALAMIFATGIAFIWQIQYGAVSGPLFVALVISYIFKDRLKDILRDYMTAAFSRHVFDRRLNVYQHTTALGTCRELFEFLETKHLPSDVRAVRELTADELPFALRQEEIMYYRKNILVRPGESTVCDTRGLLDITRLNLWELSRNMDGDTEHFLLLDEDKTRSAKGIKTYPLYIIRRHSHGGVRVCTAFRVLMDHAGVRKINRLYPVGDMPLDQEEFSVSTC